MPYTAVDLLDKAIYTAEKKKLLCLKSLEKIENGTPSYIVMNVIVKNLKQNIEYHKKLKEEIQASDEEEIDFIIYDKISFLINEFNQKIIMPDSTNIKSLISSYLNFQKSLLSLYIDIQGRLVKNEKDVRTNTYKIMFSMIKEQEKIIKNLEEFIKKYY